MKLISKLFLFFIVFETYSQNTVATRFVLPDGYKRVMSAENSFANHLQNLPLKPKNSKVKYFNGQVKLNLVYDAVVDLGIGNQDLHQCADAIMRLRADYFFKLKQYDKIHFNFTNGFRVDYNKWRLGFRIGVKGNKTFWVKKEKPSDNKESYWRYLETIFMYAGTASLDKELKSIKIDELSIGDVFIKGGFPGHAVIVVDMAENTKTKKKIFMLAQSYMPAQEIQILKNLNQVEFSPWYSAEFGTLLKTPEWEFSINQIKRF